MTVIMTMLAGVGIGAGVALVLYLLGFGVELVNCACQLLTCNLDGGDAIPGMWSGESFGHVLLFCAIVGAVIGLVYGLIKMKAAADEEAARRNAENSEEARKQRVKWASEAKKKALNVSNTCDRNKKSAKPMVSTTYQASSKMKEILNELTKVAELQGKVDSIAGELKKKGGVQ